MDGRKSWGAMDGDHDWPRTASIASQAENPRSALAGENGFLDRFSLLPGPASRVKEVCFAASRMLPTTVGLLEQGLSCRSDTNTRKSALRR